MAMTPLDPLPSSALLPSSYNEQAVAHFNFWILLVFVVVVFAVCYIVAVNKKINPDV